jgi:hypothetical protein
MARRNLLSLLGELVTMKVTQWAVDSDGMDNWEDDREPADILDGANVVTSKRIPPKAPHWYGEKQAAEYAAGVKSNHAILLDIDVPAWLVPSSTEGHSHLYVDVHCREEDYFAFLDAAAKVGLIQYGYASASKKKGATFLRLPWVKKPVAEPF